jgi:hypothetical protein
MNLPFPKPCVPDNCECGGRAWLQKVPTLSSGYFEVHCHACGKRGPRSTEGANAVRKWNGEWVPQGRG